MKRFNTTTICIIEDHYIVNISGKLEKIIAWIYTGMYFTINRAIPVPEMSSVKSDNI